MNYALLLLLEKGKENEEVDYGAMFLSPQSLSLNFSLAGMATIKIWCNYDCMAIVIMSVLVLHSSSCSYRMYNNVGLK